LKAFKTDLPGVLILRPKVHEDERGFFLESYNQKIFNQLLGRSISFVQDNHSKSSKGVLRGLHFQKNSPQAKLVRVIKGRVFDVVVDIRKSSPTFKRWTGLELSQENKKQIWVPEGFAHGFYVLEDKTEVIYKTTDYYNSKEEKSIRWDDQDISIDWPIDGDIEVSSKDEAGALLKDTDLPD